MIDLKFPSQATPPKKVLRVDPSGMLAIASFIIHYRFCIIHYRFWQVEIGFQSHLSGTSSQFGSFRGTLPTTPFPRTLNTGLTFSHVDYGSTKALARL